MTLLFAGRFNTGDRRTDRNHWTGNWGTTYACLPQTDSLAVVPAPGGISGNAGLFTIRGGDVCNTTLGKSERAMITLPRIPSPSGSHRWHGMYIYVPPSFTLPPSTWNMFWEDEEDTGIYVNNAMYINSAADGRMYWDARYGSPAQYARFGLVTPGWHEILFHIEFSSSGIIEIWIDGTQVLYKTGINNIPVSNGTSTTTIGIYRNTQSGTNQLYFLYSAVGTTKSDVAYGGSGSPPPPPPPPPVPVTYNLKIDTDGFGTVRLDNMTEAYVHSSFDLPANTSASLLAIPIEGYAFVEWRDVIYGDTATSNPLVISMTRDFQIIATFKDVSVPLPEGETDWAKLAAQAGIAAVAISTIQAILRSKK